MKLQCKNCGGNIIYDESAKMLKCQFCGNSQPVDEGKETIYMERGSVAEAVRLYHKARGLMQDGDERSLGRAADMFEDIAGLLDADKLAVVCRKKAETQKTEREYTDAVSAMEKNDTDGLIAAISLFEELGEYRDSAARLSVCRQQLQSLQRKKQAEHDARCRLEKKQARKKRRRRLFFGGVAAVVILGILIGRWDHYSSRHIEIDIAPEDEFITVGYRDFDLHFDVEVENRGRADISGLKADVIFEAEGETLIDTTLQLNSYNGAVLRGKSKKKYDWTVTTDSSETAEYLAECDFDELKIRVEITEITFSDGKNKAYR